MIIENREPVTSRGLSINSWGLLDYHRLRERSIRKIVVFFSVAIGSPLLALAGPLLEEPPERRLIVGQQDLDTLQEPIAVEMAPPALAVLHEDELDLVEQHLGPAAAGLFGRVFHNPGGYPARARCINHAPDMFWRR
jgi:hypothetical protein